MLVFVTLFYQFTVNADPEALVETYHQGLFLIDYVLAVTACIALIVLDRVVYLNRAKAAKAVYHFTRDAAFCTFLFRLYHHQGSLRTTDADAMVYAVLHAQVDVLRAQRETNPERVPTGGSGRQQAARPIRFHHAGFQVYLSVPFMYELRVLLDYACTDSSLDLFDWLKLENINRDLFRINVRNMTYRRYHPLGHLQPWWKKVIVAGLWPLPPPPLHPPRALLHLFHVQPPGGRQPGLLRVPQPHRRHQRLHRRVPHLQRRVSRRHPSPGRWRALGVNASAPPVNYEAQIQQACVAPDSIRPGHYPRPPRVQRHRPPRGIHRHRAMDVLPSPPAR